MSPLLLLLLLLLPLSPPLQAQYPFLRLTVGLANHRFNAGQAAVQEVELAIQAHAANFIVPAMRHAFREVKLDDDTLQKPVVQN